MKDKLGGNIMKEFVGLRAKNLCKENNFLRQIQFF